MYSQMTMDSQMTMVQQMTMDLPTINAQTIEAQTIDAQVATLKQSFTIKTENYRYRFICYNNIIIGKIVEVFTVEFIYYHAPTMIRLFPSIFERKYFPESLNFYIYRPTNGLTCEQLTCEQLTTMLSELEYYKKTARRTLNKYTKLT